MTKASNYFLLGLGVGLALPSVARIPYASIIGWIVVGVAVVLLVKR